MFYCIKCKQNKEDINRGSTKDGVWCDLCVEEKNKNNREKKRKQRQDNPELVRQFDIERRLKNIPRYLVKEAKIRAKKKNLEFDLTNGDITIPEFCPVLDIPLIASPKITDNSPTIDRIDTKKGYIKGNVLVVSYRANHLKGDTTPEERDKFCGFYSNLVKRPCYIDDGF